MVFLVKFSKNELFEVARFRETYGRTSRKHVSTEPIFTQIQQKRPSQTPAVAFFRDT